MVLRVSTHGYLHVTNKESRCTLGQLLIWGSLCEKLKASICEYITLCTRVHRCNLYSSKGWVLSALAAALVCSPFMHFHSAFPCKAGALNLAAQKIRPVTVVACLKVGVKSLFAITQVLVVKPPGILMQQAIT